MRLRNFAVVGLGVAALALSTTMATSASATDGAAAPTRASAVAAGSSATAAPSDVAAKGGKCGASFGTEVATPDGIIAWNDTVSGGMDNAGAVDLNCPKKKKKRTIKKVSVYGYFGTPTETFHIQFLGNSASNEPDDANVICDYTAQGPAGGQYPTHALTTIKLPKKCVLPKGASWMSMQNVNSAGPWYWEVQNEQANNYPNDWRDVNNSFGSGCTAFTNGGQYMQQCLGHPYVDYMLELK